MIPKCCRNTFTFVNTEQLTAPKHHSSCLPTSLLLPLHLSVSQLGNKHIRPCITQLLLAVDGGYTPQHTCLLPASSLSSVLIHSLTLLTGSLSFPWSSFINYSFQKLILSRSYYMSSPSENASPLHPIHHPLFCCHAHSKACMHSHITSSIHSWQTPCSRN